MDILKELFEYKDEKYAKFQARLIPDLKEEVIGVRVPKLREIAKELMKNNDYYAFLYTPHKYYDEFMLHGIIISGIKDYEICVGFLDKFLPYVNNWAVCDVINPKIFKNHKEELFKKIMEYLKEDDIFSRRFAIGMLMRHFLKEDFSSEILEIPKNIRTEEYYLQMMIAWFYATALTEQWDETFPYIRDNKLDKSIHNMTIKKALESLRIDKEKKEILKGKKQER